MADGSDTIRVEPPEAASYDLVAEGAEGGEFTVCAKAPLTERTSEGYQSEAELEAAFIAQLERQAYEYIRVDSEEALIANLRRQLEALNGISFSDREWQRFFKTCIAAENEGILDKTRRIQEDWVQLLERDNGSHLNVQLIDKRNIHNNHLQVMNQYAQSGTHDNRYDVTILVNGLPLVHVELKRRGVALREAFNQIERYQRESFWAGSGLFEYVQIFVISNGTHTKYYSNTTRERHVAEAQHGGRGGKSKTSNSFEFTMWWASADNRPIADLVPFTSTFFSKHTLLSILTRYCVLTTEGTLMVMRPYQIAATERVLNRILVSENDKRMLGTVRAGGYVWHSTGSGKTLTSFKCARLASEMEGIDKVLFVVDRKDLDYQTMREYDRFEKGAVDGSENTRVLARNLEDPGKRILVTTIQKLSIFIDRHPMHEVYGKHVVIIFDECHRGQFGDMHRAITKHFRNYHLFGFTGTPIFAENASSSGDVHLRTTEQAFGECLHSYTIVDAIRDGNVLPFRVDYINTIRERGDYEDEQVYDIYRQGAYQDKKRVNNIVGYILDHFDQKTCRNCRGYTMSRTTNTGEVASARRYGSVKEERRQETVRGFNSILCVDSIPMAKTYYTAFKEEQARRQGEPIKVGLIYSFQPNESAEPCGLPDESFDTASLDTPSRDFLDAAISDYNRMFGTSYDTSGDKFQSYYKDVSLRMKNRELDLLIVVNMFLTGFDATTLNTLWVDKNLRDHGLIQAFSRTNRILNSVKTFGNIVCFRDLEDEVDHAISLFGDSDAGGTVLLRPYSEYLGEYDRCLRELRARFPVGEPIVGEEDEQEFIKLFGRLLRLRNILVCFDEFAWDNELPEREEQDYRSMYADLYDKYRSKEEHEAAVINDDLTFEVELMRTVDINIDYILMLVEKYHRDNCRDKEILADVDRAIGAAPELRSKRDLIHAFIDSLAADEGADVHEAWRAYVAEARERELDQIISEEALDPAATREFMERAFKEGGVPEEGTEVVALMRRKPSRFAPENVYTAAKQRVIDRLQAYYERFTGLGA